MRRVLGIAVTLTVTLTLTLTLVVAATGSASARPRSDQASVRDKAGDAPPGIDLLRGDYRISNRTAVFAVKLEKLTRRTFLAFESWPLNSAWDRITVFRERGRTVGRVYFIDNEEQTTPYLRRCPGLKVTWRFDRARVRVVVPRRCMQASQPGYGPYEFHVFSRFGGVKGSARDTMPVRKLNL